MNDSQVIDQFRHLISEFKISQEQFALAIINRDFKEPEFNNIFKCIHHLVIQIKETLAQYDVLRVDDLTLRNELIAIRENKDFAYFEILEILYKHGVIGPDDRLHFVLEIDHNEWWNIFQGEILCRVNPDMLIRNKMDLGALLVGKTVPQHLRDHLGMIKESYTWGFKNAASIYCRVILEEGFREALKSKPEFSMSQRERELETWPLDWLLNHLKKNRYFNKEVINKAYKIKENVNKIVHPTSAKEPEVEMSNLEIIKDTFYILEMLYR